MSAEKLRELLLWPMLPAATRLRLRQQRYDEEAAVKSSWLLRAPGLAVTLVKAVDGPASGGSPAETTASSVRRPQEQSYGLSGGVSGTGSWTGRKVTVCGQEGAFAQWDPEPGGLRDGFDPADVAQAGLRPATSGECTFRIAAIAAVGVSGHHVSRVYFLDAESRELGWIPAAGYTEDQLIRVAEASGIVYRRYELTLAKISSFRVMPEGICEVLFPRSARRVLLAREGDDWHTAYPGARPW